MAQKVRVELVDDVDGSVAHETVLFGLDGVAYEIDLSEDNATKIRDDLTPWLTYARRVGGRKQSPRAGGTKRADLDEVRTWARSNGYQVSDRGRVAGRILTAYDQAH